VDPERRPEAGGGAPHYLVQRIREALAHDERVNELELQVKVSGSKVFLHGTVPTRERQQAVEEVVHGVLPECEVLNETTIGDYGEPKEEEKLS
jgi:hypothetical protein